MPKHEKENFHVLNRSNNLNTFQSCDISLKEILALHQLKS